MPRRPLPVQAPPTVTLQVTIKRKTGLPEVGLVLPGQSVTFQPDDNETVEIIKAPGT